MNRSAPWFKFDCRAWLDGTRTLSPEHRGIYADVLALIYDRDGPIPDDDAWMAHQLHVSKRYWRAARNALVACGKLVETADGLINMRAKTELESRADRRRTNTENCTKNSRKTGENSENANENNKCTKRIEQPNPSYAHARENSESESDSYDSEGSVDDDVVEKSRRIPRNWRSDDLEFLHASVPGERLGDVVLWLWRLEGAYGEYAVTEALKKVRPRIQSGEVKHVLRYVTQAVGRLSASNGHVDPNSHQGVLS